jgi:hypothetical protein
VEANTEHTLKPFTRFLGPNPRVMKRWVNAYGVRREVDVLSGGNIDVGPPPTRASPASSVRRRRRLDSTMNTSTAVQGRGRQELLYRPPLCRLRQRPVR